MPQDGCHVKVKNVTRENVQPVLTVQRIIETWRESDAPDRKLMSATGPDLNDAAEQAEAARAELVACLFRIAAEDRAALAYLYQRTSAKLFGICLRILTDRAAAEDVLQEVYLTVWNKAVQFDAGRGVSPITWLAVITRNRALDRLRAQKRQFVDLDEVGELADLAPLADIALANEETTQRLATCLQGLDERTAGAIRAAFFGGQTYDSLARRIKIPLGSMKSLIRRGLIRLKVCLDT
jgi:RNA polymerase sigma-70 factor (ECF subfamily)